MNDQVGNGGKRDPSKEMPKWFWYLLFGKLLFVSLLVVFFIWYLDLP
jgi:hypothetical protein